jgi:glycosyltransferase domain-containing protein
MALDARITILLTLKGRDLCTLRWLWHANRVGLPFRVFIADGDVNPVVARLIEDAAVFPNLAIDYHRYNDRTLLDFYRKLEDAVSKIKTPYVMMSDNDDFLFASGVVACLDYLDRSPAYVSMGGGIGHFETRSGKGWSQCLHGKVERFWYQQSKAYQAYDLDSSAVADRVGKAYAGFLTVCYNVFRLEALQTATTEITQFNFQRLDNFELYLILRTATLGKVKSFTSHISYLRQLGTSSNPARGKNFVASLSTEPYLEEVQKIVKHLAALVALADGVEKTAIVQTLHTISTVRLREKLLAVLGWRATVKNGLKQYLPKALLIAAKTIGERLRAGRSSATGGRAIARREIFKVISRAGATESIIVQQQAELAEVEQTMEGEEFIRFMWANAPELMGQMNES